MPHAFEMNWLLKLIDVCAITYLKLGGQQTIRIMTRNHHFCKICFRTVYSTACYLIFYVLILMLDKIYIVLKKHIPRNIIIRIGLYTHKLSPMVKKPHVSCFKIYFNLKKFSTFWYTAIFFSGDLGKQTIYLCTIKAWLNWVRNIGNTKNAFIFLCQVEKTSFCRLSMHIQIYQVCIW